MEYDLAHSFLSPGCENCDQKLKTKRKTALLCCPTNTKPKTRKRVYNEIHLIYEKDQRLPKIQRNTTNCGRCDRLTHLLHMLRDSPLPL